MELLKRIEGTAFTVMDIHLRLALSGEYEDVDHIAQIVVMPELVVQYVCDALDSDIHKFVEMSDEQREEGMSLIANIIEKDRTNAVGKAFSFVGSIINPLGSVIRQAVREQLDDCPTYIELRSLYAGFGMDLVLGVFDELMNRGKAPEEILAAVESLAVELGYDGLLEEELEYNVEHGIASGDNQKTEAKVSEAAAGVGGAIVGAKIGAILGSVIPVFGTITGIAAGGAIGKALSKDWGNKLGQENEEVVASIIDEAKAAKEKVLGLFK